MSHTIITWESLGIRPPGPIDPSCLSISDVSADRARLQAAMRSMMDSGKLPPAPDGYEYQAGRLGVATHRAPATQGCNCQRSSEMQQMRRELNEMRERLVKLESQPTLASIGIPFVPSYSGGTSDRLNCGIGGMEASVVSA